MTLILLKKEYMYILNLFIRYKLLKLNESKLLKKKKKKKKEIAVGVNVLQMNFMLKH